MTTDTLELPELPEHAAAWVIPGDDGGSLKEWVDAKADRDGEFTAPLFTAKDMRAYATAAVLAERERAARVCDKRAEDCKLDFESDGDERWLVYAKHAERLASAIRNKE